MTVLLNPDQLIQSIKHGRLKPRVTEPLLGLSTGRHSPSISHAPLLRKISQRFIESGEQEFDELLDRSAGLLKFYREHYGVDWVDTLKYYARRVRDRGKRSGLERYFQLQADYIVRLLNPSSPDPAVLKPESFDFYCDFRYRDQILQLESLFVIGNNLLDLKTRAGSKVEVWEEIQHRIMQNDKLKAQLASEWENANYHILELYDETPSANKHHQDHIDKQLSAIDNNLRRGLSNITQTEWRVVIGDAWDLITGLHEIGRFPELGAVAWEDSQIASVLEQDEILDQFQNSSAESLLQHLRDQLSHAAVNCMDLRAFEAVELSPLSTLSYILTRKALWSEVDLLRDIDSRSYSGINKQSNWDQNPLGALLATVILLAEIPTRICWHFPKSANIELRVNPWENDPLQVEDFMPVKALRLSRTSSEAVLIFERDPNEYPAGIIPHDLPMKDSRLKVISSALGPGCMGVLDAEQAANLTAKWEDCEEPSTKTSPITTAHVVGNSPGVSVRMARCKQFQDIDFELETIVANMNKWGEFLKATRIETRRTDLKKQRQNVEISIESMTDKQWDEGLATLMALAQSIWDQMPAAAQSMAPKLAALLRPSQQANS